jgi:DNA-directed RNA polymerase alpha subunit
MTFVDSFLQELHGGKCPSCGTQVVVQVEDRRQPEAWEVAETLPEIRAVAIEDLYLSVRAKRSLEQAGVTTIGELLDFTEAKIRQSVVFGESVVKEVRELLARKGLAMRSS